MLKSGRPHGARIRDVAFALIAERGVQGSTLRAIASEAGVSPSFVNRDFGSNKVS